MSNYKVIPYKDGWEIVDSGNQFGRLVYQTKRIALVEARKLARKNNKPLIILGKDGKVSEAIPAKMHIKSANVKHNFSNKEVRNSIAEAMLLREGKR
jgi:intein/homing endonuclease